MFLDEIEKAFAGTGTDPSGVKTELTGAILSWMQDRGADGCLLIGPPGAAKSLVAKATGDTAGIPAIAFDRAPCRMRPWVRLASACDRPEGGGCSHKRAQPLDCNLQFYWRAPDGIAAALYAGDLFL